MGMGNAGIGIFSRRRSELSVGTGPSRFMLGWKFTIVQSSGTVLSRARGMDLWFCLIVAAGWIILHQQNWFQQPVVSSYLVMLTTGVFIAVMVEWLGVRILRRWEYTEKMPMLPGLSIGLIPIAQMLFFPPLIFRIVAVLGSRTMWKSSKS
jgi:hypothetical protein